MNASEVGLAAPTIAPVRLPRTTSGRLGFAVQTVLAVTAVAMAIAGWWLFDSDPAIWVLWGVWPIGELIPGVIAFAAGALVLLRFPTAKAVGWMMMLVAGLWGASALCAGLFLEGFTQRWPVDVAFLASQSLGGAGSMAAYYVLPQLYPDGLLRSRVWRGLFGLTVLLIVVQGVENALWNWGTFQVPSVEFLTDQQSILLGQTIWVVALVITVAVLVERIRRGPQSVRRQVGILGAAWVLSTGLREFVAAELGTESPVITYMIAAWPPVIVGLVVVAVLLWDLYDIRRLARRAAVYSVSVLALSALFAGVFALVFVILTPRLVDDRSRWIAFVAAAVVVLAADPWRRRLHAALERRLLGSRSDPLQALARLDALVFAGTDDETSTYSTIAETIRDAVRAPGVTMIIYRAQHDELTATAGTEPTDPVTVALLHRGERLGELRIAPRTPGEEYSRADRALLEQLASQAAATVYGLRRDRDIDLLRQEALEAMAEQRLVLGRDLHDGLGPLLAGAGLTADSLRRGMPPGSPDAEEAARLSTRLRNAATEVRRIAHDLQPTGAGAEGLPGVITDYVASLSGPTTPRFEVDVDNLGEHQLPAVVELGMTRVALEAVNNVARHAHAKHVQVSLALRAGRLELAVVDDGVGISQPYVSGLGITSMRSRVEALDGIFELRPANGGGTRLVATVPAVSR